MHTSRLGANSSSVKRASGRNVVIVMSPVDVEHKAKVSRPLGRHDAGETPTGGWG